MKMGSYIFIITSCADDNLSWYYILATVNSNNHDGKGIMELFHIIFMVLWQFITWFSNVCTIFDLHSQQEKFWEENSEELCFIYLQVAIAILFWDRGDTSLWLDFHSFLECCCTEHLPTYQLVFVTDSMLSQLKRFNNSDALIPCPDVLIHLLCV